MYNVGMRMMAHRGMFNTRQDTDAGLECAGVNKRQVNRRRMENGILKYVSALCRRDGRPSRQRKRGGKSEMQQQYNTVVITQLKMYQGRK